MFWSLDAHLPEFDKLIKFENYRGFNLAHKKFFCGFLVCAAMLFFQGGLVYAAAKVATLKPSDQLNETELKSEFRKLKRRGIVLIGLISDARQNHELWSGIEVVRALTGEIYHFNAVHCFPSHCLYVGQLPEGEYFLNEAYSHTYIPSMGMVYYQSLKLGQAFGGFKVAKGHITNLGMVGSFKNYEQIGSQAFSLYLHAGSNENYAFFLQYYSAFLKFLDLSDIYTWQNQERIAEIKEKSDLNRYYFADFTRVFPTDEGVFFTTALGQIYHYLPDKSYQRYLIDSASALYAFHISDPYWIAAGENGHMYYSSDQGKSWQQRKLLDNNQTIVSFFSYGSRYYLLSMDERGDISIYSVPDFDAAPELHAEVDLKYREKSFGFLSDLKSRDSVKQIRGALTKKYFNRADFKSRLYIKKIADHVLIRYKRRELKVFNLKTGKISTKTIPINVTGAYERGGKIVLLGYAKKPVYKRFSHKKKLSECFGAPVSAFANIQHIYAMKIYETDSSFKKLQLIAADYCIPQEGLALSSAGDVFFNCTNIDFDRHERKLYAGTKSVYALRKGESKVERTVIEGSPVLSEDVSLFWWQDELLQANSRLPRLYRKNKQQDDWVAQDGLEAVLGNHNSQKQF